MKSDTKSTGTAAMFIPRRFSDAVALHLSKNILWDHDFNAPLIMGIHGPSGEGKTFQVRSVLRAMSIAQVPIAARELESERAGEPAALLLRRYSEAMAIVKGGNASAAVVTIEDLDAAIRF